MQGLILWVTWRRRFLGVCVMAMAALVGDLVLAQTAIPVANHSFESPFTFFAFPDADLWEESGPVSMDPQLPGVKDTLDTGVFFNSPVDGAGDPLPFFIPNGDGRQIAFIGAKDDDDIAFFQQLGDPFENQASYELSIHIGESFFFPPLTFNPNDPPPPNPAPALLGIRLYYEDEMMQKVIVAERQVSTDEMPGKQDTGILLVDLSVSTALTDPADAWLGEPIGVEIRPVVGLSGVWNVDNVRLTVNCAKRGLVGDVDLDGVINLVDHPIFANCITGPLGGQRPEGCPPCAFERSDGDGDNDVDLRDVAEQAIGFGE